MHLLFKYPVSRITFLAILCAAFCTITPAQIRYNVISIMSDDQALWSIGAYGNREVQTPNMDRLAREGVKFTNAFVTTPVCSPSRVALFTGKYGTEVGITDYISVIEDNGSIGLPDSAITWPQVLQKNGYRTGLFGKWHLGSAPKFHPTKHGFDYFMGELQGGWNPMNPKFEVNGQRQQLQGASADLMTDDATKWIEANKDRAFAAVIHYREPHTPYGPMPEEDTTIYKNLDPQIPAFKGLDNAQIKQWHRDYYAAVHAVDRNIGKILATLSRLQLEEKTIVIFQSDHGYNIGEHGIHTKGNGYWVAGGIAGPKRPNMWDSSLRIPMMIRWPGVVKAGTEIHETILNLDLFPSILGMLKIKTPTNYRHHGKDFTPLLTGIRDEHWRDEFYGQYDLHNLGLAYMRMLRTKDWKLVRHYHANEMSELYDLKNDPDEKRNLYNNEKNAEVRNELQQRLDLKMREINDPILKMNKKKPAGSQTKF